MLGTAGAAERRGRQSQPLRLLPLVRQPSVVGEAVLTEERVLEAIARYFGAFVRAPWRREEGTPVDLAEDAREVLERRLARLATGGSEK